MNQYQKRIIAGVFVAIAIVSALYILIRKTPVVHTAYASLLLAALIIGASLWQLAKGSARDYITRLAFPLALKAYVTTTIAMAVIFVTLDLTGAWSIPFSIYAAALLIIIGLTAWKLLVIGAAADAISQVDEQVQSNVSNWKMLQANVEATLNAAPADMQPDITALRDSIRYADPMSKPEVAPQEKEIASGLEQLREYAKEHKVDEVKALCERLQDVLRDRASKLKILK